MSSSISSIIESVVFYLEHDECVCDWWGLWDDEEGSVGNKMCEGDLCDSHKDEGANYETS